MTDVVCKTRCFYQIGIWIRVFVVVMGRPIFLLNALGDTAASLGHLDSLRHPVVEVAEFSRGDYLGLAR